MPASQSLCMRVILTRRGCMQVWPLLEELGFVLSRHGMAPSILWGGFVGRDIRHVAELMDPLVREPHRISLVIHTWTCLCGEIVMRAIPIR